MTRQNTLDEITKLEERLAFLKEFVNTNYIVIGVPDPKNTMYKPNEPHAVVNDDFGLSPDPDDLKMRSRFGPRFRIFTSKDEAQQFIEREFVVAFKFVILSVTPDGVLEILED